MNAACSRTQERRRAVGLTSCAFESGRLKEYTAIASVDRGNAYASQHNATYLHTRQLTSGGRIVRQTCILSEPNISLEEVVPHREIAIPRIDTTSEGTA
jgi:hypothetical protein